MVSHTSITQSIFLISVILIGVINTACITNVTKFSAHSVPYNTKSDLSILPPSILSRTQPVRNPKIRGNPNAATDSVDKNKKWIARHSSSKLNSSIKKRGINTVAGLTLTVPPNAPPVTSAAGDTIVYATSSQIKTLRSFAGIVLSSYCSSVIPSGTWICKKCKTSALDGKIIFTFRTPIHDINGFVLRSDSQKSIYLVFRGTRSNKNRIVNISFGKINYTPVSGAYVHQGFYNAYKEASTYFFSQLQAQHAAFPNYTVAVVGHSLGGTQALLAGMDLYQRLGTLNSNNLEIYTFGCPRVGDSNFAYYVESTGIKVSRSVHNRDIVPHAPPESFGFVHTGVEIWEKSDSDIEICSNRIESDSCSDSIVPFTSLADHFTYFGISQFACD